MTNPFNFPASINVKKDKTWMHDYAKALMNRATSSVNERWREMKCWRYYHGMMNPDDWKYLTEIKTKQGGEEFSLPSRIRNISIQRTPINLLVSQASRRPFVLSAFIKDNKSKAEKHNNMFIDMLNKIKEQLISQKMEIAQVVMQMEQQMQQLQQMLQNEPQSEEEAQQLQQIQQMIPQIEMQMNIAREELEKKGKLNKDKLDDLEEFYTYDYKDLKEILAQKGVKKLIVQHDIYSQKVLGITDRFVTGKEYRFVDYNPISNKCEYSYLNSMSINYPKISGVNWVQEGPWVTIDDTIPFSQFVDIYGDSPDITEDMIKEIEAGCAHYEDGLSTASLGLYSGNEETGGGVRRTRVYWKVPHKVTIGTKENKHDPDIEFKHFYTDHVDEKTAKKYKSMKHRYMSKVYEAVVIDGKYVINAREKTEALVDEDNYMQRYLPVVGPTFSNIANQPYSLIWSTMDLQDLYVLVHFHRELLIAVSGVKGQIIDMAQMPDNMSPEEHRYHKKTGNLYIQTVKKTGKVNSSYNQWRDFDDTLPASVQYLDNMLEQIRNTALEIIGMPRQRLGQVVNTDQVGTSEMAREQSALITEILFFQHDEVETKAMTQLINYYCKYAWEEGAILDIKTPEGIEYVKIPKGMLGGSDYEILYQNSTEEENAKHELKQVAFQRSAQGQLPFEKVLDFYDMESLAQLKKSFRHWTKKTRELAEKMQQNQAEGQKQAEMELKKFDQEFQLQMQQNELQIQQYNLKLQEARLELDKQVENAKLSLEGKKIDVDANLKMMDIASERDVEMTYLGEQNRSSVKDEQIRMVQLQMQALQIQLQGLLENKNSNIKIQEVKVKDKQATAKKKERIKD